MRVQNARRLPSVAQEHNRLLGDMHTWGSSITIVGSTPHIKPGQDPRVLFPLAIGPSLVESLPLLSEC